MDRERAFLEKMAVGAEEYTTEVALMMKRLLRYGPQCRYLGVDHSPNRKPMCFLVCRKREGHEGLHQCGSQTWTMKEAVGGVCRGPEP